MIPNQKEEEKVQGIDICTDEIFLTSFLSRDKCYQMMVDRVLRFQNNLVTTSGQDQNAGLIISMNEVTKNFQYFLLDAKMKYQQRKLDKMVEEIEDGKS